MDHQDGKTPPCFGKLEKVFPLGRDGLRHSPDGCLPCPQKVECLREAVSGEGALAVASERLERAYDSGHIGFLERWARRKAIEQKKHRPRRRLRCLRFIRD